MEKMRVTLLALLFFPHFFWAQPSFTPANLPGVGDTIYFAVDQTQPSYFPEASGSGLSWDFSTLYPMDVVENIYLLPEETPFFDTFPAANLALRIELENPAYTFFNQDSSKVTILGISAYIPELNREELIKFDDPQQVLELPLSLGDTLRDTTSLEAMVQEPNSGADLLIRSEQYNRIITDGSGDLILPGGTYPAFRQNILTERIDSLFVIVFGSPVFLDRNLSMDTSYVWLGAESKGLMLNRDGNGNWLYYAPELADLQPPVAAFDRILATDTTVQFIDNTSGTPFAWQWDFGDGNSSTARSPLHQYDTTGTYEVCLRVTNSAGSDTLCQPLELLTTSVEKTLNTEPWQVFPNPTREVIFFQSQRLSPGELTIEIDNARGQQMVRRLFYESTQVQIQDWPAQLYYYRIISAGRLITSGRFLKI